MNRNNQKGFTLILSLVLLLVMSLMGGSLIVISSTDHQSNNTSDEYQQTFYVAEHALIEAEKYLINQMIGPWPDLATIIMNLTISNQVVRLQGIQTQAVLGQMAEEYRQILILYRALLALIVLETYLKMKMATH